MHYRICIFKMFGAGQGEGRSEDGDEGRETKLRCYHRKGVYLKEGLECCQVLYGLLISCSDLCSVLPF